MSIPNMLMPSFFKGGSIEFSNRARSVGAEMARALMLTRQNQLPAQCELAIGDKIIEEK